MSITLVAQQLGKRFSTDWIFRDFSYAFEPGGRYVILGRNGAGKSTLLQILSGNMTPSRGQLSFTDSATQKNIPEEELYKHIAFAAPYTDVIEEFKLLELIEFHLKFKPFRDNLDAQSLIELLDLPASARYNPIQAFSSGMKQRVRLALAICADSPILLLDEPTVTLDKEAARWYKELLKNHLDDSRTLIIATNVTSDADMCNNQIDISHYKSATVNKLV